MTETLRCRLQKGDLELEIEGAVDEALKKQVSELLAVFEDEITSVSVQGKLTEERKPAERKTGARATIQPQVDKLIDEEWVQNKTVGEVVDELKRRGVQNVNVQNVTMALKSKLQDKLTRELDTQLNQYRYSVKQ